MLRLAIIGCGARVRNFLLPALAEMPGIRLAVLVDPQPEAVERVREAAQVLGVVTTPQLCVEKDDRNLLSGDFDAAIIASPHAFHYVQARRCILRGKPVLVEKPLACHAAQCARLFRYTNHPGVVVSSPRWFRPDLNRVRVLLRSGAIGQRISIRYHDAIPMAPGFAGSWRNDPRLAGGGVLLDLGCHTLHGLFRVAGPQIANSVLERVTLSSGRYRVETEAQLKLRLPDASIELELRLTEPGSIGFEDLVIRGTSGVIHLHRLRQKGQDSQLNVYAEIGTSRETIANGTDYELEDLRCLLQGTSFRNATSTATHSRIVRIISRAYEKSQRKPTPAELRSKSSPNGWALTDQWAGHKL